MFDPGYMNTAPCKSKISYIDGDAGILRYRGYPIEVLAEKSSYLESAFALVYGDLPDAAQLREWEETIARHSSAFPSPSSPPSRPSPTTRTPWASSSRASVALSTFHPEQNPAIQGRRHFARTAHRINRLSESSAR